MVATSLRESIIIHNTQDNCTKLLFQQSLESGSFFNTGRPEVNYNLELQWVLTWDVQKKQEYKK